MPLLMALGGLLLRIVGPMAARVLLSLGMGYVTYSGFDLAVGFLLDHIKSDMGSMPAEVASLLGFLWVDKAIGLIFSAYSAAMTVKLAGGTKLTKLITKSM